MKKIFQTITFILCMSSLSVWSDTVDDKIRHIKKEYKEVRTNLNEYRKQNYDFIGKSTEGAGAIGYLTNTGEIKLIEVTYYGETGKVYFEFYYSNKHTFFIFEKKFTYNRPFMITKEVLKEWDVEDEAFDPNKTKAQEWRYYFHENNIIKTLGPEGTIISDSGKAESALIFSLSNYKRLNKQIQSTPNSRALD